MELIVQPYKSLPCELEVFTINGQKADWSDFGENADDSFGYNEEDYDSDLYRYGCLNHYFEPKEELKEKAMAKYNISAEDFETICEELESKLYVGECGWCI